MTATHVLAGELMQGQVPLGEAICFWILGPISVAGAIGMVTFRNAIHSALSLVATMMSLGTFYVIEQGPFLGLVQIIVYTGAIMILFLFVLMLVGISVAKAFEGRKPVNLDGPNAHGSNVHTIAALLFTKYLFAFELTSALLIVAAVGAMVLAHIERDGPKPTQKSLARERIRSGRPQPLPGPGVLSTGNSIGTPALLPDGSVSHESVMVGSEEFEPHVAAPRRLEPADYDESEVRQ